VSDFPQGPGWWQASDGKWYRPEQAPGATQLYPTYLAQQRAGTSGKAVTSLVLGISSIVLCYIGFIPGIVAIVLAVMAKRDISEKALEGAGLATAGLVCGIVGTSIQLFWDGFLVLAIALDSSTY
jgi:hypothetical protein